MRAISVEPALALRPEANPRSVDRYFSFACVDGSDEIAKCFRLRYEIFCQERGFLPCEDYPDHLERDIYDAHALHFLASHLDGEPAGTVRLVLNGPRGLPMVSHCILEGAYAFLADPDHPRDPRYAEISRLAVSRGFRRRRDDTPYGGPPRTNPGEQGRLTTVATPPPADVPEMISGLFRLIYQASKRQGVTHWVVAMERSLQVMLRRIGIGFSAIGPEVDYYGPVRPYVAEISAVERFVSSQKPETRDYMVQGLESHLAPRVECASAGAAMPQDDLERAQTREVA